MEQLRARGYEIEVIVQGFPGKSVCHGMLGWSTITLLRGHGRVVLIDAGSMGMRQIVMQRLSQRGIGPGEVTDLLLTHSHHDHSINWTLFSQARIVIGSVELDWALRQDWGKTSVPELYMRELKQWPTLQTAADGDEVLPGITAHLGPGHTPGCLIYSLEGEERDVIFTGDAAKNRAELVSGSTDMSYDASLSRATIRNISELWGRKQGSVVVPGHDVPMVVEDGVTRYIGKREAAIRTWFGDDMETMQTFLLA